jgi:chromosome segregation ATPase
MVNFPLFFIEKTLYNFNWTIQKMKKITNELSYLLETFNNLINYDDKYKDIKKITSQILIYINKMNDYREKLRSKKYIELNYDSYENSIESLKMYMENVKAQYDKVEEVEESKKEEKKDEEDDYHEYTIEEYQAKMEEEERYLNSTQFSIEEISSLNSKTKKKDEEKLKYLHDNILMILSHHLNGLRLIKMKYENFLKVYLKMVSFIF